MSLLDLTFGLTLPASAHVDVQDLDGVVSGAEAVPGRGSSSFPFRA
jgi:hypothetical protein